jgi:hypothetical protein
MQQTNLNFNDRITNLFLENLKKLMSETRGNKLMLHSMAFQSQNGNSIFMQLLRDIFNKVNSTNTRLNLDHFLKNIFQLLEKQPHDLFNVNQFSGGNTIIRHNKYNNNRVTRKILREGGRRHAINRAVKISKTVKNRGTNRANKTIKGNKTKPTGDKKKDALNNLKDMASENLQQQQEQILNQVNPISGKQLGQVPGELPSKEPEKEFLDSVMSAKQNFNPDKLDSNVIIQQFSQKFAIYLENHLGEMNNQVIDNILHAIYENVTNNSNVILSAYKNSVDQIMNNKIALFDATTTRILFANLLLQNKGILNMAIRDAYNEMYKQNKTVSPFTTPEFVNNVTAKLNIYLITIK